MDRRPVFFFTLLLVNAVAVAAAIHLVLAPPLSSLALPLLSLRPYELPPLPDRLLAENSEFHAAYLARSHAEMRAKGFPHLTGSLKGSRRSNSTRIPLPRSRPAIPPRDVDWTKVNEIIERVDAAQNSVDLSQALSDLQALDVNGSARSFLSVAIVSALERINRKAELAAEARANAAETRANEATRNAEMQANERITAALLNANKEIASANSTVDFFKWAALIISIFSAFGIVFGAWNGRLMLNLTRKTNVSSSRN
jgi:hypothetical protein